jgi:hypothetical protein
VHLQSFARNKSSPRARACALEETKLDLATIDDNFYVIFMALRKSRVDDFVIVIAYLHAKIIARQVTDQVLRRVEVA